MDVLIERFKFVLIFLFLFFKMRTCDIFIDGLNNVRMLNATASSESSGDATIGISASVAAVVIGLIIFLVKKFTKKEEKEEPKEDVKVTVENAINRMQSQTNEVLQTMASKLEFLEKPPPVKSSPPRSTRKKKSTHRPNMSYLMNKMRYSTPVPKLERIESNSKEEEVESEEDFIRELSRMHKVAMSFCEDPDCDCKSPNKLYKK